MPKSEAIEVDAGGIDVRVTSPDRVVFAGRKETKLDLVNYYLAVADGALLGVMERPTVLKRYPKGASEEPFFQKRVPDSAPPWIPRVNIRFPSGRDADELCPTQIAHIIWAVNLGCLDLNPWPVRRNDVDHPDELRIDLDPQPGLPFDSVRKVALACNEVLKQHNLIGYPKTSGSRGIHINVRIDTRWDFQQVRRAALALGRAVERELPDLATTKWWKEERGDRVFIDYNQNARDRTVASAYSVRANDEARVSTPLLWEDVADVEPNDFTLATVPARYAKLGDLGAGIDNDVCDLTSLLELSEKDEREGLGDAPWPPNFAKQEGEPTRVQPSRARDKNPDAPKKRSR